MAHPLDAIKPGIKVTAQMSPEATPQDLEFVKMLGVTHAVLWTDATKSSYDYYASRRDIFAQAGIEVYGFGNVDVHNVDAITLNLPERDAKIEEYKQHIRNLGKAGIPYTTYAHMGNGIWSTAPEKTPRGALGRAFDLSKAEVGHWNGREFRMPLSHDRVFSKDEIWDNYAYFIKQVAPVAEEAGVMIGIHPDDPPQPELAGVPRCIFSSFAGYEQALDIADSPNVGMCLCVGCWLEGGDLMGKGVLETIRRAQPDLQGPLPQYRQTPSPLCRDVPRRRLYGHVPSDEGPARSGFQGGRYPRPYPTSNRRWQSGHGLYHRPDADAATARGRRSRRQIKGLPPVVFVIGGKTKGALGPIQTFAAQRKRAAVLREL
jgi:mannonate dehydratase